MTVPGKREQQATLAGALEGLKVGGEAPESDELARFRREWEVEVRRSNGVGGSQSSVLGQHIRPVSSNELARRPLGAGIGSNDTAEGFEGASDVLAPLQLMRAAVIAFAQAVESERRGNLDEALTQYRKAFKMDSSVDRLYERASSAVQAEVEHGGAEGTRGKRDVLVETEEVRASLYKALNVEDYRFRAVKEMERQQALDSAGAGPGPTTAAAPATSAVKEDPVHERDQLSALIDRLSVHRGGERNFEDIHFTAEDEEKAMPIARLPEEVLLHILGFIAAPRGRRGARIGSAGIDQQQQQQQRPNEKSSEGLPGEHLVHEPSRKVVGIGIVLAGPDYMSIEQLARVCWKFRLLTRAWSVWRLIVRETYFPPQIPSKLPLLSLAAAHNNDWRTAFVEQPRLRLNGAYIAACHYTRAGMHEENVWVRVVHVVEFYRSLRFLPDGRTLSLLTTDAPSQTVRKMEPSLRGVKGFAIGNWTLHPQGLADDDLYARPPGPKVIVDDLQDKTMSRYTFRLILKLDKTSRGKWNRLDVLEYESVNLESGEICPLPLNHKKPFHFSTVRSYGI